MDSLKFLLYTLARVGIMIVLVFFAAVCGRILFPLLASFVPDSMTGLNDFFTDRNCGSFAGWLIMLIFMAVLFFDDGKRHAAYEQWSAVNVSITLIIMLMVYFIPAIFRDSFAKDGQGAVFYEYAYFTDRWLYEGIGLEYTLSAAVGIGLMLAILLAMYVLSFKAYAKKHPVILRQTDHSAQADGDADGEETEQS